MINKKQRKRRYPRSIKIEKGNEKETNSTTMVALIQCVNTECSYHERGFKYKIIEGELSNSNDDNAYNLIIECPEKHKNKIWVTKLWDTIDIVNASI